MINRNRIWTINLKRKIEKWKGREIYSFHFEDKRIV